jgi:plasmid rolling circle replication initiator protein Rep
VLSQVLSDKRANGKERPWKKHKVYSLKLAEAFYELGEYSRSERVSYCASDLFFAVREDGSKYLKEANFCRERLCPMCQWRRSLRTFNDVTKIVEAIGTKYAYLFMTLTVRNCTPDKLSETLDDIATAWNRFSGYAEIKRAFKGTFRSIEVKHNITRDEYHPHLHVLIAVNPSYFKSKNYVSQKRVVELWQRSARLDYTPICDIRRVKGEMSKAVVEAAKYATKADEMILFDDWEYTLRTVELLLRDLSGRRFISYGGVMREIKQKLGIRDVDEADLVHIENEETEEIAAVKTLVYRWLSGYGQYMGG